MPGTALGQCLAREPDERYVCRICVESRDERRAAVRSLNGATAATNLRRGLLPRHDTRQLRHVDLSRQRGSHRLPTPARARRPPLPLADPRLLPDGQSLPPRGRDPRGKPRSRDARPERRLRSRLQRPAQATRSPLRPPLLGRADRRRHAAGGHARLRLEQSRPRGARLSSGELALVLAARTPSDRFASTCRTTPTS